MASTHIVFEKFQSGDNWESYSEQLEQYFVAYHIPVDKQASVLLAALSPPVYRILRDVCVPDEPGLKTYAQLSGVLRMLHSQETSVFQQRINFHKAVQSDDETVNQWLNRIMNLAIFCEFGNLLDSVLRDKFLSGLADPRIASRLCEENDKATLRLMVDVAVRKEAMLAGQSRKKSPTLKSATQLEGICGKVTNILDIPNEILVKVILYLNARERVPLGNSCKRLNSLVFKDEELLRDLDFSKEGHLTSMSDIEQYFHNENTSRKIHRVNIRNVKCLKASMLANYIGRAINLVDINIDGIEFKNIWQLGCFINPLLRLKKLSILWQIKSDYISSLIEKNLLKPFNRLTYLSVSVGLFCVKKFLPFLQLCQELKKLRIVVIDDGAADDYIFYESDYWDEEPPKVLRNLEIIEFCGYWAMEFKARFVAMLPEPEKWTDFQLNIATQVKGFYLEKNVEVCEELLEITTMNCSPYQSPWSYHNLGWALVADILLKEVVKITHQNVPQNFCCLSVSEENKPQCILKLDDAKRLLKDPTHQISYLYVNHPIKRDCDLHLLASAFPKLTELFLGDIKLDEDPNSSRTNSERRLRRKGSAVLEVQDNSVNLDSCFKMLVENTPDLRHLTIEACSWNKDPDWDLDALYLISGWKRLRTLRLWNLFIEEEELLFEIGKQCKDLQELEFINLKFLSPSLYQISLLKMLSQCKNLRDFAIETNEISYISKVFAALVNNKELRRVRGIYSNYNDTTPELISSIEQLLYQCSELTTFICQIRFKSKIDSDKLSVAVCRWRREIIRPNFQVRIISCTANTSSEIGIAEEDAPQLDPLLRVESGLKFTD